MAGGGDVLKLLGSWWSPFVIRVKVVLNLKGLSYENVEEDRPNKSELLLKSNPVHKKIPVLIHNGKPICESMIIVQYIDEAFAGTGPSILPSDPYERAIARFWAAYIDDKLFGSLLETLRGKSEEERAEAVKQAVASFETMEGAFKECSKGKDFFGGNTVGYVDVALGGLVALLNVSETVTGVKLIDAGRTPLLAAWAERFGALDAAKEVIPEVHRLMEYGKQRMQAAAAADANN